MGEINFNDDVLADILEQVAHDNHPEELAKGRATVHAWSHFSWLAFKGADAHYYQVHGIMDRFLEDDSLVVSEYVNGSKCGRWGGVVHLEGLNTAEIAAWWTKVKYRELPDDEVFKGTATGKS